MIKLQQFTFVCAPQPVQWAGVAACDVEFPERVAEYRLNRDFLLHELGSLYEFAPADGAFYLFAKAPWGTGSEFVAEAIRTICSSFRAMSSATATRTFASLMRPSTARSSEASRCCENWRDVGPTSPVTSRARIDG